MSPCLVKFFESVTNIIGDHVIFTPDLRGGKKKLSFTH
jgi:hypothetical protein